MLHCRYQWRRVGLTTRALLAGQHSVSCCSAYGFENTFFTFFSKSKNATFYVFRSVMSKNVKKRRKRCPSFQFCPLRNC